jgi:hypothetical protein
MASCGTPMLWPAPGKASERDHNPNLIHRNQPWESTAYATLALTVWLFLLDAPRHLGWDRLLGRTSSIP